MKVALAIALLPLLPLLTGVFSAVLKLKPFRGKTHYVGVTSVGISMLLSFFLLMKTPAEPVTEHWFTWVVSGGLSASFGAYVDSLTAVMLVIVTFVSFFVHVYSVGYMHGDPGYDRFFAYLGLFTFSMLVLVLSPNFLQLFFGWEAVGLSSYLLIGFWYEKKSAADAAVKAFIMNRVGDFLFILGVALVFITFGTLDFGAVFSRVHDAPPLTLSLLSLLLLGGAVGKSAQFPLHTWLPDAMEGPTPISALIHAATMVAAGVFMVARCSPIYDAGGVLTVVGIIGVITAFGSATIALTQFDIKRVLAYSTLSQLGYMFTALGVGAYVYAIFHLFTHAFFKALLFLGSGSVIHALEGEQDIRRMGGLYKHMKLTATTFIVASLALAGIPPLAGFFSKDRIIGSAFANHHYLFWFFLTAGAMLTALYMGRLVFMVFFGEERFSSAHVHESPPVMTVPLIALAVPSIFAGFLAGWFSGFTSLSIPNHVHEVSHGVELSLVFTSVLLSAVGIALAVALYITGWLSPARVAESLKPLHTLLFNKYYFDQLYDLLFVKGTGFGAGRLSSFFDRYVIDGIVNGVATCARWCGDALRLTQTGLVNTYVAYMFFGIVLMAIILWIT